MAIAIAVLVTLAALLSGGQVARATAPVEEVERTESEADGCLIVLLIVAGLALFLIMAAGAGAASVSTIR